MDIIEEIYLALLLTHPADLHTIRRYIAWVSFRRRMHNQFYFMAHWVPNSTARKIATQHAHWINE